MTISFQVQKCRLTLFCFWLVPGGARRRRTTGPQAEDECWYCGKRGHWQNECKNRYGGGRGDRRRSRSPGRRSRSPRGYNGDRRRSRSRSHDGQRSRELREGRCFICYQKGHIKRDCPEFRGGYNRMERGGRYERRDYRRDYRRDDRREERRDDRRDDRRDERRDRFHHRRSDSRSRSRSRDNYRRGGDMGEPQRRHDSRSPAEAYRERDFEGRDDRQM